MFGAAQGGQIIATKRQRLHETVILARTNNHVPSTHNQNEGNWTLIGVEPILAALEWLRVAPANRLDPDVDGAAYEWPSNHKVDVVLFADGQAIAVMENKDTMASARSDLLDLALNRKVSDKHRARLDLCIWGLYSWHMEGGGFGWIPYVDGKLDRDSGCRLQLNDVRNVGDADSLAQLAKPVLMGEVTQSSWLEESIDHGHAIKPRYDLLAVQQCFFDTLVREMESCHNTTVSTSLRCWEVKNHLPTPTRAYTDLPGLLPQHWGLAFEVHPMEDWIQCLFYRESRKHDKQGVRVRFDRLLEPSFIEGFVRSSVMPRLDQHRKTT